MLRIVLALVFSALLAGCNNTPNYINVPANDGDIAFNSANNKTVRTMERIALSAVLEDSAILGDVAVRFPEGTTDRNAIAIVAAMPDNVFVEGQAPSDEVILVEIRGVHARTLSGWVDIIRPGQVRLRELVSVEMQWRVMDGWHVVRLRPWAFDPDKALHVAPDVPDDQTTDQATDQATDQTTDQTDDQTTDEAAEPETDAADWAAQ